MFMTLRLPPCHGYGLGIFVHKTLPVCIQYSTEFRLKNISNFDGERAMRLSRFALDARPMGPIYIADFFRQSNYRQKKKWTNQMVRTTAV